MEIIKNNTIKPAKFSFIITNDKKTTSYHTAVMVTENKSPRGEMLKTEAIVKGFLSEDGQKPSNLTENDVEKQTKKQTKIKIPEFPSKMVEDVYKDIKMNRKAKYSWLADNLGASERTILRAIKELKELGYINSEHSKVNGEWQLLK